MYEPPYPPSYGLNSTTTVLLGKVDMPLNKETKPNQTDANVQKVKKAQKELTHTKQNKKNTFKVRLIK